MLTWLLLLFPVILGACASAPAPASRSALDPSNPSAEETRAVTPSPSLVATAPSAEGTDAGVVYACPMHPDVTASEPGHRCPKCGMTLVPRRNAR